MSDLIEELTECADEILGLRDEIGAIKHTIKILTRVWALEKGDGTPIDTIEQVLPTPYLVQYSHRERIRSGGKIKEGDLMLKHISKQSRPLENDVNCYTGDKKIEKFYYIDGYLYNVLNTDEDYIYWNIQVRKNSQKKVSL